MTINERFFKLLDEKKVSQKDFCEATGIPKQTVSCWKNRKTDPPASLIPTIAAYFGITSDFLLTGKDECNQADLELNDTSTPVIFTLSPSSVISIFSTDTYCLLSLS